MFISQFDIRRVRTIQRVRSMRIVCFALLTASVLASCVSAAKYDEMETAKNLQLRRADSLQLLVNSMLSTITRLDANIAERAADSAQLHDMLDMRTRTIDSLKRKIVEVQDQLTATLGNYNQLKATNVKEVQKLLGSLEKSQQEVNTRQQQVRERDSVLSRLQQDLAAREKRLKDVEQKLQARDAALKNLRARIADALLNFKDGELTITLRNGLLYVSLSNQLLFASGSTDIEKKGKTALKQLATALNKQADINITVEGHTDDAKLSGTGALKDNWDLSVMRATEVIRFLTGEGKIDPKRITAAGRGEFIPVEAGSTPEIRAKNRRTEIILTPKLDELFEIIEKR